MIAPIHRVISPALIMQLNRPHVFGGFLSFLYIGHDFRPCCWHQALYRVLAWQTEHSVSWRDGIDWRYLSIHASSSSLVSVIVL